MDDIADRLRLALGRRERSIRSLQRALHGQGVQGSSYASVHNYMAGRTEPPLEFLRATAEELGVRLAWLALGEGEPTEAAEQTARSAEALSLEDVFEPFPALAKLPPDARLLFLSVLGSYGGERLDSDEEQVKATRAALAALLLAPFEMLGYEPDTTTEAFGDYAMGMLLALRLALNVEPEEERGQPDGEDKELPRDD